MQPAAGRPAALALLVLLVSMAAWAGCLDPPAGSDDGAPGVPPRVEPEWSNPYSFPVHFDGWRAYEDLLSHIYEDPVEPSGPRYRVAGTSTHAVVADELLAWLEVPLESMAGQASQQVFNGSAYYGLDLAPVASFLCGPDDAARERVGALNFTNIVGRTDPDAVGLVIGAHWDSKRHVEPALDPGHDGERVLGADDGASGTVAVIELARAFARTPVDLPITFVLFDGEDGFDNDDCHPLAGSLYYAQSLDAAEQETVAGMILLDMVGNQSARFYREGYSQCYPRQGCDVDSRWLVDHVWGVAGEMGAEAFVNSSTGFITDDHLAFLHEGVPSIDIIRYENRFPPYWHTTRDDHTAVHPLGLHRVGHVVEASVRLLDAEPERIPAGAPAESG